MGWAHYVGDCSFQLFQTHCAACDSYTPSLLCEMGVPRTFQAAASSYMRQKGTATALWLPFAWPAGLVPDPFVPGLWVSRLAAQVCLRQASATVSSTASAKSTRAEETSQWVQLAVAQKHVPKWPLHKWNQRPKRAYPRLLNFEPQCFLQRCGTAISSCTRSDVLPFRQMQHEQGTTRHHKTFGEA